LHYITGDPTRMRICYQLVIQAENDATGRTGDRDRFAEFTIDYPRDAMTILLYALTL
jgi:isocitrate dehydrogenase kinase/phosphatase